MRTTAATIALLFVSIAVSNADETGSLTAEFTESPIVIRFSHVVSEDTAKGIGADLFRKRVEQRLAGKVRVEVYPRSQKFNDEEIVTALLLGDVQMGAPSFAKLTQYAGNLRVLELPFLFPDLESVHLFQESPAGRDLLNSMLPIGVRGLAYWDNGMRVMSSDRPLRQPSDAEGLVFRIEPSAVFHEQYSRLGAAARPMPFSRLTDAIREGWVTGQENTWSNIYSRDVHRFHKHFTELDHSFLGYMVITSDDFWKSLPADIRGVIEQIIAEVTVEVNKLAAKQAAAFRQKVMEVGDVAVIRPTPENRRKWLISMCQVWAEFVPDIEEEVFAAALGTVVSDLPTAAGGDAASTDVLAAFHTGGTPCPSIDP